MELSYNELREKEVVSVREGKSLGKVSDLVFCYPDGGITGIIVPGRKCWSLFKPATDLYIDWHRIKKIGRDVIIVDLRGGEDCDRRERERDCPPPPRPCRPPRREPREGRNEIYPDDYE